MGVWFRLAWGLCLALSFTACTAFPPAKMVHQTSVPTVFSPSGVSDTDPVASGPSHRSDVPVSRNEPLAVLTAMPTGAFDSIATFHLSQNRDGSISVLSGGRPDSLLKGLDPALVNLAVLPFLFPSCNVPPSSRNADRSF